MKPLPPSVVNAARWIGLLQICAWLAFAVGCGAAMAIAVVFGDPKTASPVALATLPVLAQIAAIGFLAGACFLPAWLVVAARARVAEAAETLRTKAAAPVPPEPAAETATADAGQVAATPAALPAKPEAQLEQALADLAHRAGWQQLLLITPPAVAALALAWWAWPFAMTMNDGRWGLGLVAIIAAFPLLVLERRLSSVGAEQLPEASALARILRLCVWSLLIAGACTLLAAYGIGFARYGMVALAALTIAVAGELALRGASAVFLPPAGPSEATALGDSAIANLVFAHLDPRASIGGGLKERFGIDLSQSWAMRFVRRAALPLAAVLAVIAWGISGLTSLAVDERGVYEAWGVPVAVFAPGLHVHLPWPFGRVRRVELGRIHSVSLGADSKDQLTPLRVDEDPGQAWDRLWDRAHPRDSYFLVPGPVAEQQQASQGPDIRFQLERITPDLNNPGIDEAHILLTKRVRDPMNKDVWIQPAVLFKLQINQQLGDASVPLPKPWDPKDPNRVITDLSTDYVLVKILKDVDRIVYYEIRPMARAANQKDMDLKFEPKVIKTDVAVLKNTKTNGEMTLVKLSRLQKPGRPAIITPEFPESVLLEKNEFEKNPGTFGQNPLAPPEPIKHAWDAGPLADLRKAGDDLARTDTDYFQLPDGRLVWWEPINHKLRLYAPPDSRPAAAPAAPSVASQVVDRGQGLHLINCDIGIIYRVGLRDQDARDYCYSLAEPEVEVTTRATRLLTQEFGRVPVGRLIAEDRDVLRESIRAQLQAGLDVDHSGIEITAVVIDAIHPPVATALAYHGVQAAEIIATTDIYRAKSERARAMAEAERDAAATRFNGQAEAGELVSKAGTDLNQFSADAQAYASGGRAYVMERWLQALARGLREGRLLIIDHRLDAGDAPTLDLRRFAPSLTTDK